MKMLRKTLTIHWGEKSLVALYISVLSGIILSLQYDPGEPYYSVNFIELLVPFGSFWRALHYYSSQMFFILSIFHLLVIMYHCGIFSGGNKKTLAPRQQQLQSTGKCKTLDTGRWVRLIASIPVILLLLFTGYVLRGDSMGESAGVIAENITLSLPVFGEMLNRILFSVESKGVLLVYADHLIGLGILWGFLSWDHLHRFKVSWKKHAEIGLLLILVSAFLPVSLEAEKLGVFHRPGPWFFLGLQELLRYVQPLWAGIVFPLSVVAAMCLLLNENFRKWVLAYVYLGSVVYLSLTAIALCR